MKKVPPSEQNVQAIQELLSGMNGQQSGEQLLSQLVKLSTERVLQELLEEEQRNVIGRCRERGGRVRPGRQRRAHG